MIRVKYRPIFGKQDIFFLAFAGLLIAPVSMAESKQLQFQENVHFAPYFYRISNANGAERSSTIAQGYVPALLKYFADDYNLDIRYLQVPRKRLDTALKSGQIDASILSKSWVGDSNKYIYSQEIGQYTTVLISTISPPDLLAHDNNRIDAIKDKRICAVRGYVYPMMQPLWNKNRLKRISFSNELVELRGLLAKRCQYALFNLSSFNYYKKQFPKENLHVYATVSSIPLTIGFAAPKAEYAQWFDKTINRLKTNGELAILQRIYQVESSHHASASAAISHNTTLHNKTTADDISAKPEIEATSN